MAMETRVNYSKLNTAISSGSYGCIRAIVSETFISKMLNNFQRGKARG